MKVEVEKKFWQKDKQRDVHWTDRGEGENSALDYTETRKTQNVSLFSPFWSFNSKFIYGMRQISLITLIDSAKLVMDRDERTDP